MYEYDDDAIQRWEDDMAAHAEAQWQEHLTERYAEYCDDCKADGDDPMPKDAWVEDYEDRLIADAERRAEEGV
jgi:endo-beta-N-acetylglucosaminidase D